MENQSSTDLAERTFLFATRIVKLCCTIQDHHKNLKALSNQLMRSGTSIGANIHEAKGAQSKADFIAKYHICLKEARETHCWLRLLSATECFPKDRLAPMLTECEEITKMIVASLITIKKNQNSSKIISS
ncbi:MAG: four helix bundle protein [Candidatus Zixiibacteriota bacterium]|nr:MAG: four helix bundle protein [candidate division Zixibacteria bacterium]